MGADNVIGSKMHKDSEINYYPAIKKNDKLFGIFCMLKDIKSSM